MILNGKAMKDSQDLSTLVRSLGDPKSVCWAQACHKTTLSQNIKFIWKRTSKREMVFSDVLKDLMVPWPLLFS